MVKVDRDSLANRCLNFVEAKKTFYFRFLLSRLVPTPRPQSTVLDCLSRRGRRTSGEVSRECLKSHKKNFLLAAI
jgi:hypothetical protein